MNIENKKEIYDLLCELKEKGKVFNMMTGSLYSSICADEMNDIYNTLKDKHSIDVQFYQPCEGRVVFYNLDELIDEYKL
jgi:hypothetical protein